MQNESSGKKALRAGLGYTRNNRSDWRRSFPHMLNSHHSVTTSNRSGPTGRLLLCVIIVVRLLVQVDAE